MPSLRKLAFPQGAHPALATGIWGGKAPCHVTTPVLCPGSPVQWGPCLVFASHRRFGGARSPLHSEPPLKRSQGMGFTQHPVHPSLSPSTQQLDLLASPQAVADLTSSPAWTLGQATPGCHLKASPAAQSVSMGASVHCYGVSMSPPARSARPRPGRAAPVHCRERRPRTGPGLPGLGWWQRARPSSVGSVEASVQGPGLDGSHSQAMRYGAEMGGAWPQGVPAGGVVPKTSPWGPMQPRGLGTQTPLRTPLLPTPKALGLTSYRNPPKGVPLQTKSPLSPCTKERCRSLMRTFTEVTRELRLLTRVTWVLDSSALGS